jgi:hypothetical protein
MHIHVLELPATTNVLNFRCRAENIKRFKFPAGNAQSNAFTEPTA